MHIPEAVTLGGLPKPQRGGSNLNTCILHECTMGLQSLRIAIFGRQARIFKQQRKMEIFMRNLMTKYLVAAATIAALSTIVTPTAANAAMPTDNPVRWCKQNTNDRDKRDWCYRQVGKILKAYSESMGEIEDDLRDAVTRVDCLNVVVDAFTRRKMLRLSKTPFDKVSSEIVRNAKRKARKWQVKKADRCETRFKEYLRDSARSCTRYIDRNDITKVYSNGKWRNRKGKRGKFPSTCR